VKVSEWIVVAKRGLPSRWISFQGCFRIPDFDLFRCGNRGRMRGLLSDGHIKKYDWSAFPFKHLVAV